jgi:hypothetical protein
MSNIILLEEGGGWMLTLLEAPSAYYKCVMQAKIVKKNSLSISIVGLVKTE